MIGQNDGTYIGYLWWNVIKLKIASTWGKTEIKMKVGSSNFEIMETDFMEISEKLSE